MGSFSSATRRVRRFFHLPWSERWLITQAALVLLPAAVVATRLARWGPVREEPTSSEEGEAAPPPTDVVDRARAVARLVRIAARYGPVSGTCLERSVATKWVLDRRGLPARIRVGVRREGGILEAHAWVECEGVVVDDDPAAPDRYHPLPGAITPRGLRFS